MVLPVNGNPFHPWIWFLPFIISNTPEDDWSEESILVNKKKHFKRWVWLISGVFHKITHLVLCSGDFFRNFYYYLFTTRVNCWVDTMCAMLEVIWQRHLEVYLLERRGHSAHWSCWDLHTYWWLLRQIIQKLLPLCSHSFKGQFAMSSISSMEFLQQRFDVSNQDCST